MTIQTSISFKEYLNLLFRLTYKKPIMIVLLCVAFAMVAWILGYYLHLLPVPEPKIYQYITLTLITIVQPVTIFWTIKRNYDSSNLLSEKLEIVLNDHEINVRGESFYMEIQWDKFFKIQERRKCFLIYQNTLSAIIIPKKDLDNTQLEAFISILANLKNVPVHLMKQ